MPAGGFGDMRGLIPTVLWWCYGRYVAGLQQDDITMPPGPVIMSPDRLFTSLVRLLPPPDKKRPRCKKRNSPNGWSWRTTRPPTLDKSSNCET